jgi:hypothetical protein
MINRTLSIGRIVIPWAAFFAGLALLVWLHTFEDQLAHRAIGPLLLLLWTFLLAFAWDGCKVITSRSRYLLFAVQAAASLLVCVWFVSYLISQSIS